MSNNASFFLGCSLLLLFGVVDVCASPSIHPAPSASEMPTTILAYDYIMLEPPLPKEWLDKRIGELEERVKEAAKQPGGEGAVYSYKQFQNYWRSRNKARPTMSGAAQYWSKGRNIAWVCGNRATFYNEKYITTAKTYDMGLASSKDEPDVVDEGKYSSVAEMARALGVNRYCMARQLRHTLLAPDIIEAILDGREPEELSLERLRGSISTLWKEQRNQLFHLIY